MRSGNRRMRRAVFVGAILALGSAGAGGSTSGLASGWLSVDDAVEAQAMEQLVGGQYPEFFVVVLQAMCFGCAIDVTFRNGIDWAAVYHCMFICDMAF